MASNTENAASAASGQAGGGGSLTGTVATAPGGGDGMPSVSVPSGGGTLRNMGDSFTMSRATGTGSYTVPLRITPGRADHEVSLSLDYSTGGGNGAFGLGWNQSLELSVSRKTNPRLPQYMDSNDEQPDIFVLSGHDELVPVYKTNGDGKHNADIDQIDGFHVRRFRPRIEETYTRIELWTNQDEAGDMHWRTISPDNETSIFGRNENSRIYAKGIGGPAHPRIFSWLLSERFDCRGNAHSYVYKTEDSSNVDTTLACEANRSTEVRSRMRYLKRVFYGNTAPLSPHDLGSLDTQEWLFELVYDYGDHNEQSPLPKEDQVWTCRKDAFSSYRSGFEVRTYRLCRRILMFHHFEEKLGRSDYLVSSTELKYDESDTVACLQSLQHVGHILRHDATSTTTTRESPYLSQSIPPISFGYTRSLDADQMAAQVPRMVLDAESCNNVPSGVSDSYRWLDLLGEGIPGIFAQQAGEWFHKDNLSPLSTVATAGDITSPSAGLRDVDLDQVQFGPLNNITNRPFLRPEQASALNFVDVAADGALDLVYQDQQINGFFRSTASSSFESSLQLSWQPFRAFTSMPTIDMNSPLIRYLDLTGDGLADIVVVDNDLLVWYESLGERGYSPASTLRLDSSQGLNPGTLFCDENESIHLADMSGDGMVDIVRIRNGIVCYWPNMGYGYFGTMVVMDHTPIFDSDTAFSARNFVLCDVDGSGTTDLMYHSDYQVTVHLNSAGNAFQRPISIAVQIPFSQNVTVSAVDLLGNGTNCIVWSLALPSRPGHASIYYTDLNNGRKPHLLEKVSNNMGVETEFKYAPSTMFYLKDKMKGTPWVTRLPYPVHCIEQVVKRDLVSGSKYVQRYSYHHGSYDPLAREFAGFAMVEQWDTEVLELHDEHDNSSNWNKTFNVPPAHTKSWFHTGVFAETEVLSGLLAKDYYKFDGTESDQATRISGHILPELVLSPAHSLTLEEQKQAARVMRGQALREEVYTDDGTEKAHLPLSVKAYGSDIECLQPSVSTFIKAVFSKHSREDVEITCDRLQNQLRIEHNVTLERDTFGNSLKHVSVHYGRQQADRGLTAFDQSIQAKTIVTYTENTFTLPVTESVAYHTPLIYSVKTYDITGLSPPQAARLFMPSDLSELLTEPLQGSRIQKKLLTQSETRYRQNNLAAVIESRRLESLALPDRTYSLCLLPTTLDDVSPPWRSPLVSFEGVSDSGGDERAYEKRLLLQDGGYIDLFGDGRLWKPDRQQLYHPSPSALPADELELARSSFFCIRRLVDAYNAVTLVDYDEYSLSPIRMEDSVKNVVSGELDYRVLKIYLTVDENKNRSTVLFDALGDVTASAIMGKARENVGDSIAGLSPIITDAEMEEFFQDPLAVGPRLLGNASSRYFRDYHGFARTGSRSPTRSAEVIREIHASESAVSPVVIKLDYVNGFGQTIQQKQNAEPESTASKIPRWRCSQYVLLNNKGLPVEEFEPFFDDSPDFKPEVKAGLSTVTLYDSIGREIATIFPNKSWTKTVYSPWVNTIWDANDTILIDPLQDPYLKPFLQPAIAERCTPTWYNARKDNALGRFEKLVAEKVKEHANTPESSYYDSMGRIFLNSKALTEDKHIWHRTIMDTLGRVEQVQDQDGRSVLNSKYDMLGRQIYTNSLDSGQRWTLIGSGGENMVSFDDRGFHMRFEYDSMGRPTNVWCQNKSLSIKRYLVTRTQYGEDHPTAEKNNLRGKTWLHFDQSGRHTTAVWDFKSRLLLDQKRIARTYSTDIDWQQPGAVTYETKQYVSAMRYDALDRVTSVNGADDSITRNTYLPGGLLGSISVNTRNEKDVRGALVWKLIVSEKRYDALQRKVSELQGNGTRETITYDPATRQVSRQIFRRNGVLIQDHQYTRDPCHHAVHVQSSSQLASISRFENVSADQEYTYDALYRLIKTNGRENVAQTKGRPDMPGSETVASATDDRNRSAMKRYSETYTYDDYNNMTSIVHDIESPQFPGWTRHMSYEQRDLNGRMVTTNKLSTSTISGRTESYTYDAHGNLISMPHMSKMTWDCFNQLRSSSTQNTNNGVPETTWYVYDSSGSRVRKVTERYQASTDAAPRKLTDHIYVGAYDIYQEFSGDGQMSKQCETLKLIDDSSLGALIEFWSGPNNRAPDRLMRFQVNGELPLTSIELDDNGREISYEEYTPYGSTTYTIQTGDAPKLYRYSVKRKDKSSGLYYFGQRYYISWLCRWLNPDPAGLIDGTNSFEYCSSNPVVLVDPDGLMLRARSLFSSPLVTRTPFQMNQFTSSAPSTGLQFQRAMSTKNKSSQSTALTTKVKEKDTTSQPIELSDKATKWIDRQAKRVGIVANVLTAPPVVDSLLTVGGAALDVIGPKYGIFAPRVSFALDMYGAAGPGLDPLKDHIHASMPVERGEKAFKKGATAVAQSSKKMLDKATDIIMNTLEITGTVDPVSMNNFPAPFIPVEQMYQTATQPQKFADWQQQKKKISKKNQEAARAVKTYHHRVQHRGGGGRRNR